MLRSGITTISQLRDYEEYLNEINLQDNRRNEIQEALKNYSTQPLENQREKLD